MNNMYTSTTMYTYQVKSSIVKQSQEYPESKHLQTIKISYIPVHSRYENASVKLKWKNERSKLFEVLDSKILKISEDKDLPDNISVGENTGRNPGCNNKSVFRNCFSATDHFSICNRYLYRILQNSVMYLISY
ncbi:Protein of unknown function [Cotesia congregata]|uniref:Uncharacterized protein n=1 Tax=Cotesia congregata TaxID=51543 RepID=A0A8J2H7N6_COTCN|nr:Protein of unknown function [Cotesia congregata]